MSENRLLKEEKKKKYNYFLGSVSSTEKSGRFVVVKSSDVSDSNENGNFKTI